MAENLTIQLLEQIRDEIRGTNARVDQTNERLDQTNERLDQTNERLDRVERRQLQSETRLATEIVGVVGAVNQVRDLLRDNLALGPRVEDHERRIRELEQG